MSKKAKSKEGAKAIKLQRRHHRQWMTFLRMCRYGINNFTRNAWLTVAATAIMTITLFVVFVSVVAHNILSDTVNSLRDQVTMSIYLEHDTKREQVDAVVEEVKNESSVVSVTVKTPEQAREEFVNKNRNDESTLDAVKLATDTLPWTVSIKIQDINDTSQLAKLVKDNDIVKEYIDKSAEPSFAGSRRDAIQKIAGAGDFAQKTGIIASVLFVGISMLIIFNTIRMAIFNRREEIQMMKLIGAERSFIRGPFLVEAIVYGFFAALVATAIGLSVLAVATPSLTASGINAGPTVDFVMLYSWLVLLAMVLAGAFIGIVSSLLATQRYLKV